MKLLKTLIFSLGILFSANAYADLMCVITPAHDNPFFKAEADIAQETGEASYNSERTLTIRVLADPDYYSPS